MFAQTHVGVDPWVAASQQSQHEASRQAATRSAVVQAVRERRNASRPARRSPWPARVEPVATRRTAESDASVRSDEFTPVG